MKQIKKLYKVEVRWVRTTSRVVSGGGTWEVRSADGVRPFTNKLNAVRCARQVAKANQPSSLIVYDRWQQHQAEYTYPRSRDPKRSKG
jgi:hypothetical protein